MPGSVSEQKSLLHRNHTSKASEQLPAPGSLSITSHRISLPDLVTPAFCVLPAETCTTSVFSMGRRRGVVIPLPHV